MKNILSLSVICFGLVWGAQHATAQYPVYGHHAPVQHGYVQSGYGHHHDYHHGHQYAASPTQYYSGYGSSIQTFTPSLGSYGVGYGVGQTVIPATTQNYTNNYYGQPVHRHHAWHPGHYLLGHH